MQTPTLKMLKILTALQMYEEIEDFPLPNNWANDMDLNSVWQKQLDKTFKETSESDLDDLVADYKDRVNYGTLEACHGDVAINPDMYMKIRQVMDDISVYEICKGKKHVYAVYTDGLLFYAVGSHEVVRWMVNTLKQCQERGYNITPASNDELRDMVVISKSRVQIYNAIKKYCPDEVKLLMTEYLRTVN